MTASSVNIKLVSSAHEYQVTIGNGLLAGCGSWARRAAGQSVTKIAIISNPTVFSLYGDRVQKSLQAAGFKVSHFLMKDGERFKTLRTAEDALRFLSEQQISRSDAIVALGGGVVGDLAGFAASVYLRGVSFLQIPTTLLAMVDASVGGKTGVNTSFGKNLVGAFHQPRGVLIDVDVLATLPGREVTAGRCEMVKHAAISGRKLLTSTAEIFSDRDPSSMLPSLIAENVRFKASIVAGDERESPTNHSSRSRKILNFGHTFAHALEKVTDYKRFRHGEAVGYGLLFAGELSKTVANCPEKDIRLLYDVVHRVGSLPPLGNIDENELLDAFSFDKKSAGGSLQMVLLKGIGKPVIVTGIPRQTLKRVLKQFLQDRA